MYTSCSFVFILQAIKSWMVGSWVQGYVVHAKFLRLSICVYKVCSLFKWKLVLAMYNCLDGCFEKEKAK